MLHEILLALSGHESPLLQPEISSSTVSRPTSQGEGRSTSEPSTPGSGSAAGGKITTESLLSPPERALLADLTRLSHRHIRLRALSGSIASRHPSVVARAVGAAVQSVHLAEFQRDVLATEAAIQRRDPMLVGAYEIVPLTAVASAFADWPRRFDWLWEMLQYAGNGAGSKTTKGALSGTTSSTAGTTGAQIINRLRSELQTGYSDIESMARSLVRAAETAWLKQVSAWILYGRLPAFGGSDFFVQQQDDEYVCVSQYLPSFVTPATAASMLFIGRSLVHMRADTKSHAASSARSGGYHLSAQLQELAQLAYPLDSGNFSRTIAHIRTVLSQTALRTLLPPSKVVEMLQLLRDFFLLGRGEFAMALVEQADETMRNRWQRADHLVSSAAASAAPPTTASGLRSMSAVIVKDGEVAAVLARTWAMLGAMQGRHANTEAEEEEDEGLELAREVLRLAIQKSTSADPPTTLPGGVAHIAATLSPTPFRNLLFSVPVNLTLQIPYPLDLVLSPTDLHVYAAVHAYLLSIRRAHIRLTGLWKLSSLRRHHPPPPGPPYGAAGKRHGTSLAQVRMLRERYTTRANSLRSVWATSSAAIFFLSEIEGYLQVEVVMELWEGFQRWLTTGRDDRRDGLAKGDVAEDDNDDEDVWMAEEVSRVPGSGPDRSGLSAAETKTPTFGSSPNHDPQTLAIAHRQYLRRLVRRLLLDRPDWTEPLYALLVSMDQLVALVHRLHGLWAALDLEADAGVVDEFVDLDQEQTDVMEALAEAEQGVRQGVESVITVLQEMENEDEDDDMDEDEEDGEDAVESGLDGDPTGLGLRPVDAFIPRRVGGLDRLLMKLDFGTWTGTTPEAQGWHTDSLF